MMTYPTSLPGIPGKTLLFTIILILSGESLAYQSCGSAKLPSEVNTIVNDLGTRLPGFMNQASSAFTPQIGEQAKTILDMISKAADLTDGKKKTKDISDLFTNLGKNNLEPFLENWKNKGKLSSSEIASATKDVNVALQAIKKAGSLQ
jgi:hypothetical protein